MPIKKLGEPTSTAVIYIGPQRYQLLAKHAREISYLLNANIKPSAFIHYLIDEFVEKGRNSLIEQLQLIAPKINESEGKKQD